METAAQADMKFSTDTAGQVAQVPNKAHIRTVTLQWNPSNPDTFGTIPSVLISGVKNCTNASFGDATTVPFIEVRCPYFRAS